MMRIFLMLSLALTFSIQSFAADFVVLLSLDDIPDQLDWELLLSLGETIQPSSLPPAICKQKGTNATKRSMSGVIWKKRPVPPGPRKSPIVRVHRQYPADNPEQNFTIDNTLSVDKQKALSALINPTNGCVQDLEQLKDPRSSVAIGLYAYLGFFKFNGDQANSIFRVIAQDTNRPGSAIANGIIAFLYTQPGVASTREQERRLMYQKSASYFQFYSNLIKEHFGPEYAERFVEKIENAYRDHPLRPFADQ